MSEAWVKTRKEQGQAIVLIALGFIVLLGFAGLAIDVGRVFYVRGQLRRAVDAGGLAAAGQFRLNANSTIITKAARQLILSHGFTSSGDESPSIIATAVTSITVQTCLDPVDPGPAFHCNNIPRRKLVRVSAEARVPMIFMELLGIPTVTISAEAMSEAAAVDAVLVLDASEAESYDAPSGQAYCATHPCTGATPADNGCRADYLGGTQYINACIHACNAGNDCHPFKEVKEAAKSFIDKMYQDYDRIGVVNFNRNAAQVHPLDVNLAQAKIDIDEMDIPDNGGAPCLFLLDEFGQPGDELWKCASSNLGGGILKGSQLFATNKRPGSLWTMIVLGSGGADSTDKQDSAYDADTHDWGFCPPRYDSTYQPPNLPSPPFPPNTPSKSDPAPLCRSRQFSTAFLSSHKPITTTGMVTITYPADFDAKDYAVMWGQYVGSAANEEGTAGMGVLMFTIGLGQKVVCTGAPSSSYNPTTGACTNSASWDPNYVDPDTGLPNGAESLLRYLAVTGNGSYPATDACTGVPSGQACDNYYFAPSSSQLNKIFLLIAGRIFTRLTG